ncbi:MAG TPA: zinc ribbon domain-containing protein [Streptosporangiaceae bacterium]|nr:zinc ribbon domain-containing protein [Streptosporangiaceae bacterium]
MCPQCQAPVRPDADFCTNCGAALSRASASTQQAQYGQPQAPQQYAQQPQQFGQPQYGQQPQQFGQHPQQFGQQPQAFGQPGQVRKSTPSYQFSLGRLKTTDLIIGGASVVVFISLFLPWFGYPGFAISGMSRHSFLAIALIASLVMIGYLVLRSGWDNLPFRLPIAHAPLLLIGTVVQLFFVVIAFLFKPTLLSWEIGAYLGLLAAALACAVIAVPAIRSLRGTQH